MSQSDLFEGTVLKDEGQRLVESHNDDFVLRMRQEARKICFVHGSVTSDDLREYAQQRGLVPKHRNAYGAIFLGKEWESIGYERSRLV